MHLWNDNDTRHSRQGGGILASDWLEPLNTGLWLAAGWWWHGDMYTWYVEWDRGLWTLTWDIPGAWYKAPIGHNILILASDWLDVITGQCIAMCCHNMSQHWSYLRLCLLVFIWTKWLDLNQIRRSGCHNVWDSTFPAHSTIAPWDIICMWALSQFPYWG